MSAVWVASAVVFGLILFNTLGWPRLSRHHEPGAARVSVLIPARNEEANISAVIETILAQAGAACEILVYDDHSTDRTAEIVSALARDNRIVRLLAPENLPPGWCGKPFACAQLAAAARGEWLLFLDADSRLRPGAIERMVGEAERRGLTLLSCWPGLELNSFWEKLLMPMLNHVVFSLFPAPLSVTMGLPALGLAHGACILTRRAEYELTGGHAMVRGELFEDTALARAWRAAGQKGLCLDGQDVVRVRMYESLRGIWVGFLKNAYPAFRHEVSFWLFLGFHFTVFVLPFVLAPLQAAAGVFSLPGWGAVLFVLLGRAAQARRFGYPLWPVFLHPVAELALIAVALTSWLKCHASSGIEWKGRTYRGRS